jgi:hypothetical protein
MLTNVARAYEIGIPINNGQTQYTTFNAYLIDLVSLAINIGGLIAILVIIYGAFLYVTSAGDEAKAKNGKDIIVGSLIGFILLVLIKVLVPILGIK